jgi:hypothetical protein
VHQLNVQQELDCGHAFRQPDRFLGRAGVRIEQRRQHQVVGHQQAGEELMAGAAARGLQHADGGTAESAGVGMEKVPDGPAGGVRVAFETAHELAQEIGGVDRRREPFRDRALDHPGCLSAAGAAFSITSRRKRALFHGGLRSEMESPDHHRRVGLVLAGPKL